MTISLNMNVLCVVPCWLAPSRHAIVSTNVGPLWQQKKLQPASSKLPIDLVFHIWVWYTTAESPKYENNTDKHCPTSGKCYFDLTKLHLALHASIKIEPTYSEKQNMSLWGPVQVLWEDSEWVHLQDSRLLLLCFVGVFGSSAMRVYGQA